MHTIPYLLTLRFSFHLPKLLLASIETTTR
jgi:hypothetical protein